MRAYIHIYIDVRAYIYIYIDVRVCIYIHSVLILLLSGDLKY